MNDPTPRAALSADTSAAAEDVQLRLWREMSDAEKARLVTALSQSADAMARAGILHHHPALGQSHIAPLTAALEGAFYVDRAALERAVRDRSSANVIHLGTSVKVDLFVAGGSDLDDQLLQRRLPVALGGEPLNRLYVH